MRNTFVAIALALTLYSAFAIFSTKNFIKAPFTVVQDSDTNFTNKTYIALASITGGDLHLVSQLFSYNSGNSSANNWNLWWRKIDTKTLTTIGDNSTAQFTAPVLLYYYNGYAVGIGSDNDTNTPQLRAYQIPLTGGSPLPRLQISSNTDQSFTPNNLESVMIGKTFYVFYLAADKKVNVTSFQIGSGAIGTEFTLSTVMDKPNSLNVKWGEALNKNQILAVWVENNVLKEAIVDVSKGTVTTTDVGSFDKSYSCSSYVTDKKFYGALCSDGTLTNVTYYVRTNTTSLAPLVTYPRTTSTVSEMLAYGPYLCFILRDSISDFPYTTYLYEIWDLEHLRQVILKTQFLTISLTSTHTFFKAPNGGLYTLLYNNKEGNGPYTSVQVGLLLDGSYITPILGFMLAIISALLLL